MQYLKLTKEEVSKISTKHCAFEGEGTYLTCQFTSLAKMMDFVDDCVALNNLACWPTQPPTTAPVNMSAVRDANHSEHDLDMVGNFLRLCIQDENKETARCARWLLGVHYETLEMYLESMILKSNKGEDGIRLEIRGTVLSQPANEVSPKGVKGDAWKEAVLDQTAICHMPFHEGDPRKTLDGIISWHVAVSLDPAVSSNAEELIERGRKQAVQDIRDAIQELYRAMWKSYESGNRITSMDIDLVHKHVGLLGLGGCLDSAMQSIAPNKEWEQR